MARKAKFGVSSLLGLGIFLLGAASYFAGVPLPINCRKIICVIGTSFISLDMIMMALGVLLIILGPRLLSKSKTKSEQ